MAKKLAKWEKKRLILLVKKAVCHAIEDSPAYFDKDEKETLELLEKMEDG